MKKKVLLYIIVSAFLIIGGCGVNKTNSIDGEQLVDSTMDEENDNIETEEKVEQEEAEDNDIDEVETDTVLEVYGKNMPVEYSSWQEGYLYYVNSIDNDLSFTYAFIYMNDDSIPEMVCDTGSEAGGCQILTYSNGYVNVLQTSRLYFTYIEKENLLCNSEGNMGYYYDDIYAIQNGKWVYVAGGKYGFSDKDGKIETDVNGEYINDNWVWEGIELYSQAEYDTYLKNAYTVSSSTVPKKYYDKTEVISYLKAGTYSSENNKYEFIKADITWSEAFDSCKDKGGYLATITSLDEFEEIANKIASIKEPCSVYFVGGEKGGYGYNWIEYGNRNQLIDMPYNVYNSEVDNSCMWMEGEPSYSGKKESGEEVDENVLAIIYVSRLKRYYLVDVPDQILEAAPSYSEHMGYICEFNQ